MVEIDLQSLVGEEIDAVTRVYEGGPIVIAFKSGRMVQFDWWTDEPVGDAGVSVVDHTPDTTEA